MAGRVVLQETRVWYASFLAGFILIASSMATQTTDISDLRQRAEAGDTKAQYSLARAYRRGEGVPEDLSKAVHWSRQAAEQGHKDAQLKLGGMYQSGQGVPKDTAEGLKWWEKAWKQDAVNVSWSVEQISSRKANYPVAPYILRDGTRFLKIVSVSGKRPRVFRNEKITTDEMERIYFWPQRKFAPGMVSYRRQSENFIGFPVGQQSRITGNLGAVELQLDSAVKSHSKTPLFASLIGFWEFTCFISN